MTQEEKQLLLQDLSARVPYGVCVEIDSKSVDGKKHTVKLCEVNALEILKNIETLNVQPILRPTSSMTEEERYELQEILGPDIEIENGLIDILDSSIHTFSLLELQAVFDWLNKNHFDFRNLIGRGLAIEVTENNNPYKE